LRVELPKKKLFAIGGFFVVEDFCHLATKKTNPF
jgi:hypothetical protein